jgi:hypothetical protein
MVPLPDLDANPVSLTIRDGDFRFDVTAERGKGGKVWMVCQCGAGQTEGWCRHRLDLLCQRYDAVEAGDGPKRESFQHIVSGTPLAQAGQNAARALDAFDKCLVTFDRSRPAVIVGRHLGRFTDTVSDLAACAGELEDALSVLRRLLERS